MLGIDPKTARVVWTIFLFAAFIAVTYAVRKTLVVFVIALFFAYMLSPLVDLLASKLPRLPRIGALALVYILLVGFAITGFVSLGGRIGEESASLANRLPTLFQNPDWMKNIWLPHFLEPMRDRLITAAREEFKSGVPDLMPYLTQAGSKLVSGLSVVLFAVLVPILAFFFLKDGQAMRESILDSVAGGHVRPLVEDIMNDIHTLLGQYIRALVLLSLATFLSYMVFLSVTAAPYAVLLAVVAGLFELIPVVGPLCAALTIVLVTAFAGYTHISWFVIFYIVYRLVQDYVISPYLMSSGVALHPLLVLFGVLAGEQIAGVPGMFFSVPVIATLRVIYVRSVRAQRHRELDPNRLEV